MTPGGQVIGAGAAAPARLAWTDQHRDVVGQFTATGTALSGSVTYDPLGVVVAGTGLIGHLGYQSEWTESLTGRVNMLSRWYNTDTGQFDTRDAVANSPLPAAIDANRYQYGNANPLTTTDPTGQWGFNPFKAVAAVTSFVQKTVVAPAVSFTRAVTSVASSAFNYVASGRAWNDFSRGVTTIASKVKKAVTFVADTTYRWAKKKVNKVKDALNSAVKCMSGGVKKCVTETAKNVVKSVGNTIKSTVEAIKKDPWKFIATAAVGLAATLAVGALCATGVGCLLVAGAVAGAMASGAGYMVDVARGDQKFSWGGLAGTMLEGGLDGALSAGISKFTGGIGGKLGLGGGKGPLGNLLGKGRRGESEGGGASTPGRHRDSEPSGSQRRGGGADDQRPASGGAPGCHSFDPATPVLMADGSTKPIEDVRLGDRVRSTDPQTGTTVAKPVTLLHLNKDTDLTDVTVRDGATGKKSVLHTTDHHPFWDATAKRWVDAADLAAGPGCWWARTWPLASRSRAMAAVPASVVGDPDRAPPSPFSRSVPATTRRSCVTSPSPTFTPTTLSPVTPPSWCTTQARRAVYSTGAPARSTMSSRTPPRSGAAAPGATAPPPWCGRRSRTVPFSTSSRPTAMG